ncbi:hypothetical protein [uncultured Sphingomonas sp.]|uniref:DUF6975 family protein n=1 Tax=uncultured Sphingomonas sp. TaxID=158754 RepID=UPI0025F3CCD8|nr:hypothetical protein [uncultured Sphingomonas sp.]
MVFATTHSDRSNGAWTALAAMVENDGSRREGYCASLLRPDAPARDLADAVHCLCLLHGRQPGVIDSAAARPVTDDTNALLEKAAAAYAEERATLIRLVAAVGPLPSTPGQAETEAAIAAQRHALDMLATSDRKGCPMGASLALMLDWAAIRAVLDATAARVGIEITPSVLPTPAETATLVDAIGGSAPFDRALLFGAQQLLAQHHALWQLLEARAEARNIG